MKIFKEISPLREHLHDLRLSGKTIGLVPTMGALHKGHLSLISASKRQNDVTVCSVFVNPTQFNNPADLIKYPRTLEKDTELLKQVQCDVMFCPDDGEMYRNQSQIKLAFKPLDEVMEGAFRPGHFSGVALVVSKLFNIVLPDHAYFGQKDWQQFTIIKRLVIDLDFPVKVVSVATLREDDGLALSSRNLRLDAEARSHATVFFKALSLAKTALRKKTSIREVKEQVKAVVEKEHGVRLDYFEVADSENLNLLENVEGTTRPIMCIAGYVGDVRLIDNMFVNE